MFNNTRPLLIFLGLLLTLSSAHATLPIETWQTSAGTRVLFVETHDLPMLDVAVDFPAGASRNTRERSGLAALTLGLMRMGTETSNEEEISARLADVGADLSSRFDTDRAGYSIRTLSSTRERAEALAVLADVLHRPVFAADILEREKQRLLSALREADTKSESLLDREFKRQVYGDHPYALRERGEVSTVAPLTRKDLQDFHQRYYGAGQAVISIIGDVTRAEASAIAERLSAGLRRNSNPAAALPAVSPVAQGLVRRIAHPASQAHIAIGQAGIKRLDPDYFPLWLGNYVLGGGGFSSRLNAEIRQKRGFAYSAYSYFSPLLVEGPFQIGLQTRKDQADEALKVARDTLASFIADGPTQEELDAAKQNVVGGFPLRIDSNRKILEYLSIIGFYRLPLTYLEDFPAAIEAVTLTQVKEAFRRRIHPERMVTVIVGGAQSP
jgi:zinc protease